MLKLLLLGSEGGLIGEIVDVLRGLGLHDMSVHEHLDEFMERVVSDRPDLVLMELSRIRAEGDHALSSADWALRAAKTPAIVLLDEGQEQDRYLVEMSSEFEHFLDTPFTRNRVSQAIEKIVGTDAWVRVTGPRRAVDTEGPSPPRFGSSTDTGRPAFEGDGTERTENTAQLRSGAQVAGARPTSDVRTSVAEHAFDRSEQATPAGGMASVSGASREERATGSLPVIADDEEALQQPDPTPINLDASKISAHSTGPVAATHEVRLPDLRSGRIADVSVPELMHGLAVSRASGVLVIEQSTLRRELVYLDGSPGRENAGTTLIELDRILSAFTWRDGTYEFVPRPVAQAQFLSYGNVYELLYGGISRHLGINEAATLLGPYLKKYPALTDRVERLRRVNGVAAVLQIIDRFTGRAPFEKDMLAAGVPPEEVLHAAYFALLAGALTFHDQPRDAAVHVVFVGHDGRDPAASLGGGRADAPSQPPVQQTPEQPRRSAFVTPPPEKSGFDQRPESFSRRPSSRGRTTSAAQVAAEAVAVAGMLDDRDAGVAEQRPQVDLRSTWATMSSQTAYELFGLSEGCGADAVTERFYELVRDYHPDQFARSRNPDDRALAETIFLHVRTMYARLHETERAAGKRAATSRSTVAEDMSQRRDSTARAATVPPADPNSSARVSTVPPGANSAARITTVPRSSTNSSGRISTVPRSSSSGGNPRVSTQPPSGDSTPLPEGGRVERRRRTITNPGALSAEEAAAAAAEVRRRRSTRRNTTGGNRATVADAVVQHLRQTGQHGAVTGPPGANPPDSQPVPQDGGSRGFTRRSTLTTPLPSVGALSPQQLVRNAHKAMVSGAHKKAADLIALAKARGAEGPVVESYAVYLDFITDQVGAEATVRRLGELAEEADEASDMERSQIYVFWGHVLRIEEDEDEAGKKYQTAMMLDGSNAEATRWHRHLKLRGGKKKSNSFLDKLLNTKITFTGNKK